MSKKKENFVYISILAGGEPIAELRRPLKNGQISFGCHNKATIPIPLFPIADATPLITIRKKKIWVNLNSRYNGLVSIKNEFFPIRSTVLPYVSADVPIVQVPVEYKEVELSLNDQVFFTYQSLTILIKFKTEIITISYPDWTPVNIASRIFDKITTDHPYTWVSFLSISLVLFVTIIIFNVIHKTAGPHTNHLSDQPTWNHAHIINPVHYLTVAESAKDKINNKRAEDIVLRKKRAEMFNEFGILPPLVEPSAIFVDKVRYQVQQLIREETQKQKMDLIASTVKTPLRDDLNVGFNVSFQTNLKGKYQHLIQYFSDHLEAYNQIIAEKKESYKSFQSQQPTKEKTKVDRALDAFASAVGGKRGIEIDLQMEALRRQMLEFKHRRGDYSIVQELQDIMKKNRFIIDNWSEQATFLTPTNHVQLALSKIESQKINLESLYQGNNIQSEKPKKIKPAKTIARQRIRYKNPPHIENYIRKNKRDLWHCIAKKHRRLRKKNTSIEFIIDRYGDPLEISFEGINPRKKSLRLCIINKISNWKFPVRESGPVYVSFNIALP